MPRKETISKSQVKATDREAIILQARQRYRYLKQQKQLEKEKSRKKKERESEPQVQMEVDIDWTQFIIVETIEFNEDEQERPDLQEQVTLEQLGIQKFEEQPSVSEVKPVISSEMEPGMKIVEDYEKPVDVQQVQTHQICPKCGKSIPQEEWKEHLRIELLDKQWRNDKEDYLLRKDNPNIGTGEQISKNLERFQARREGKEVKTSNEPKIIWDGHSNSITRTTANSVMMAQ